MSAFDPKRTFGERGAARRIARPASKTTGHFSFRRPQWVSALLRHTGAMENSGRLADVRLWGQGRASSSACIGPRSNQGAAVFGVHLWETHKSNPIEESSNVDETRTSSLWSDEIPKIQQEAPNVAQGQHAVRILLYGADQPEFPIGAQGTAAIYTNGEYGAWAAAQDFDPRPLVVEPALSDQFLKRSKGPPNIGQQ